MTWLHSATVQFPRVLHHSKRMHRWVGIKVCSLNGCRDPKCPSAKHLCIVREDTGPLVKGLHVPRWRPIKQLAARVHFLRCGRLFDGWSVYGVLSIVFVKMTSLGSTGPNTSSQHNQSGLIDELLT
ncbi:uncharacterized protein TNCV_1771681 [Trichonephila clavipes]|nr:uncharacterized protein TNCV_1771681 [Trichonephila clavipes]